MRLEELQEKLPPITSSEFELAELTRVNQKPHPYCITPKHLSGDHMYLNDETIEEAERKYGAHCGMYGDGNGRWSNGRRGRFTQSCRLPYEDHTKGDHVLFVRALVHKEKVGDLVGLNEWLLSAKPVLEACAVDGVAFIGAK